MLETAPGTDWKFLVAKINLVAQASCWNASGDGECGGGTALVQLEWSISVLSLHACIMHLSTSS